MHDESLVATYFGLGGVFKRSKQRSLNAIVLCVQNIGNF
jgi:hypothetical protein